MRQAVQVLGKGEELLQHGAGDVHTGGLGMEGGTQLNNGRLEKEN